MAKLRDIYHPQNSFNKSVFELVYQDPFHK